MGVWSWSCGRTIGSSPNLHSRAGATRCSSSHFHLTRWNVRPNSIRFWIYASSSHAKLCLSPRVHRHLWFLASILKLSGQRRAAPPWHSGVALLLCYCYYYCRVFPLAGPSRSFSPNLGSLEGSVAPLASSVSSRLVPVSHLPSPDLIEAIHPTRADMMLSHRECSLG